MLFNSVEFFIFLAIVYSFYLLLPLRGQNWLLLLAGYVFYGWWDPRFLFLIAFSTTVDFWIGSMLGRGSVSARQRKIASIFILGAAFFFLNFAWSALLRGDLKLAWAPTGLGFLTVTATALIVLFANLTYARVVAMEESARRKLLLLVTVSVNLSFLGIFKYFNFFVATARPALAAIGLDPDRFHLDILLPVGISFYTFQSLSYTLDAAHGRVKVVHRFWDFALFVAFFPPMVAGPIERARHLLPQLLNKRTIRLSQSMHGLVLILLGLFKKVAIADGLAPSVNAIYNSSGVISGPDVALATLLFAFQILCDFSGYSDIARGVAKLLGIELMTNFNLPYLSTNPSEFWRRWHISLSSWLRDYLYVPLGGNRKGEARTYINLMATMVLGGLWHGAAANYILWGGYQGALLCAHRAFSGKRDTLPSGRAAMTDHAPGYYAYLKIRFVTAISAAALFLFVCYGWLLFRAHSFSQIVTLTAALAGFGPHAPSALPNPPLSALVGLVLFVPLQFIERHDGRPECFRFWPPPLQGALYAAFLFILAMGTSNAPAQFIYFQF